jgi:hypothetical protein
MQDALLHVIGLIFGSFRTLTAPVAALIVSVVYFRASPPTQPLLSRLLASAHGVAIALAYALMWLWAAVSDAALDKAFECVLLLPVALMVTSFFIFKGPAKIHFLQLVNVGSLVYIAVLGAFVLGKWKLF